MADIAIRLAESDPDVVAIHAFLVVTMGPLLPGPIAAAPSATEVWRVVNNECALMAMLGNKIVGTIGIVKAPFWWSDDLYFLANRWFSALPGVGAGRPLIEESIIFAKGLADANQPNGPELHIYDEQKGRITILNRDPRRRDVNPILARPDATQEATGTLH